MASTSTSASTPATTAVAAAVPAISSSHPEVVLVQTRDQLRECVQELQNQLIIAIDLEGVDLGADGEICIIQISTGRRSKVFLIDVCALGKTTFADLEKAEDSSNAGGGGVIIGAGAGAMPTAASSVTDTAHTAIAATTTTTTTTTSSSSSTHLIHNNNDEDDSEAELRPSSSQKSNLSLRTIFKDPSILKLMWDVRSDSNALFGHFQVQIENAYDLQLFEIANRIFGGRNMLEKVSGLGFILERTSLARMTAEEQAKVAQVKGDAINLFAPEHGGSYNVWKERPLNPLLIHYATDSIYFFSLYESFLYGWQPDRIEAAIPALRAAVHRRMLHACDLPLFASTPRSKMTSTDTLLISDIMEIHSATGSRPLYWRRSDQSPQTLHHHHQGGRGGRGGRGRGGRGRGWGGPGGQWAGPGGGQG